LLREKKNLVVQSVVLVVGLAEMVWCALAAAVWGAGQQNLWLQIRAATKPPLKNMERAGIERL
tara:strand:- start:18 stop:206 length:189 start_codon:yes stop_codon:yes gene_type:complete